MRDWQKKNQRTLYRAVRLIQAIPFVRMIALTGSIAEKRDNQQSDIDLFIETAPGHIWLTRLLVVGIIELAGIRRTNTKIAGRICLNWFATFPAPANQDGRIFEVVWQDGSSSSRKSLPVRQFFEYLLKPSFLEKIARSYQIKRIDNDSRSSLPGSQVRYSDHELGFHPPKNAHTSRAGGFTFEEKPRRS